MTTIVTADKSRLTIHGVKNGRRYLVSQQGKGWWIVPAPEIRAPKRRKHWKGPQKDLSEYLDEMAKEGFSFGSGLTAKVPPCQF